MENEEDCKEEWSKRKKSKFSYIHLSKNKIEKLFSCFNKDSPRSDFKSIECTGNNTEKLLNISLSVPECQ